ncbi:MAG: hypothetical protein M0R66_02170 [Candidatus Omnitrophica bacterium]|jgi:hypothetical protein|nr:hypothetical protein [Sphaerochaeta sp.]MCK9603175.1 hypothetical protein [Candidatus Omnitrophota bacterium]
MKRERAEMIRVLLSEIEPTNPDPSYGIRVLKSVVKEIVDKLEKEGLA